ncbi:hypothetical protein [Marinobacter sp. SS21]|uniref:hypothetical protein n=1 Tax=Marinobacter sp. SS21 TaxID=2979460 RepID=UPI00232D045B|nr:hypothetical protein [Marinobacter sp. SS21]MDC0661434.1 hypothetical protein [Marinobacter sp. SS21]
MMVRLFLLTCWLFASGLALGSERWAPYPDTLTPFEYSEQNLGEHWLDLTGGFRGPLPSATSLRADAERWPELYDYTRSHLKTIANSHPELAYLTEGDLSEHFDAYATELRRAWSLLFNGQFRQARDLGLSLGPAGYFPGLYAQVLYASLLGTNPDERQALLEEVIERTREILPMAPDHPMIRFGNAYGKARILEDLSASRAMGTGYTSEVLDTLNGLLEENPDNVYAMTLMAGVESGIIEKAGSMVARLTYGAKASSMERQFERALELAPNYPGVYYEYARAKLKVEEKDGVEPALVLLNQLSDKSPNSAEEALLLQAADRLRQRLED